MNKKFLWKRKKKGFCCNYNNNGGVGVGTDNSSNSTGGSDDGDIRVHSHVESGRGRFQCAAFLTFFLLVLCIRRQHTSPTYYYNNYNYFCTYPRTHTSRWWGGTWEMEKDATWLLFLCFISVHECVCVYIYTTFFLLTVQRRNMNVYMMNIYTSPLSFSLSFQIIIQWWRWQWWWWG